MMCLPYVYLLSCTMFSFTYRMMAPLCLSSLTSITCRGSGRGTRMSKNNWESYRGELLEDVDRVEGKDDMNMGEI